MHEPSLLSDLLLLLLAPVIIVPLFQRLRTSPIVGYLVAGIVIGPDALGLIAETPTIDALAELGVAFLLFAIGLELSLQRLRLMRRLVFGLGGSQVLLTGAAIGLVAWLLGASGAAAIVIGGALALSSTAFVLQLLVERGEQVDRFGRTAFAILLFQDLAVVPLLVLVPLLGADPEQLLPAIGLAALKAGLVLGLVLVAGRLVLRPIFRVVAATRSAELFVSATLLVVLGLGWLMTQAGLSMPLGAFLAGLLLSETEYRHQVEADIRPFRGLLLGLFFITVGLGMDLGVVLARLPDVALVLLGLITGKALLITALCLAFRLPIGDALRVGLLLAEGGEFAFVLMEAAMREGVLPDPTAQVLMASVALSLIATPFLAELGSQLARRIRRRAEGDLGTLRSEAEELSDHVIIAGFGRVGQTIAKLLAGAKVPYVGLDLDPIRVARCRDEGLPAFYADASRMEVLAAAGAGRARAAVITIDQPGAVDRAVAALHQHFPELRLFVRGRDLRHRRALEERGATAVVPEAVEASLQLGGVVLESVGASPESASEIIQQLRRNDYAGLEAITGENP